jgi:tetratricopeptide (TPR) repeat protein
MPRLVSLLFGITLAGSPLLAQAPEPGALERYAAEGQKALAERRWADAARAYEKLRELSPETAEVHAQLGMIYFQQQAFARAVPTLRQALKLKPGLPNVDILLAMCLSEIGQYKKAVPGLERGFGQSPDTALRRMTGLQLRGPTRGSARTARRWRWRYSSRASSRTTRRCCTTPGVSSRTMPTC